MNSYNRVFLFAALAVVLMSVATSKKDKQSPPSVEEEESADAAGGKKEKFYRKRDLQRITELLAEISQLQSYLDEERAFLTDLLISSLSISKPEVAKVENLLEATKNVTKSLNRFYHRNTLIGRPARMAEKHMARHPEHVFQGEQD